MKAKELALIALIALLCAAGGFYIGRQTTKEVVSEKTEKGEPVTGSFSDFKPYRVENSEFPDLPMKRDTVWRDSIAYVAQKVDTAAIIAEYQLKQYYRQILFNNDKIGKLELSLTTQYNRLSDLTYSYTPVYTVKTVAIKRVWIPFVSASYSTLYNNVSIGGGFFYNDLGVQIRYSTDFNRKGIESGLIYKF